jgi:hypothetical protein
MSSTQNSGRGRLLGSIEASVTLHTSTTETVVGTAIPIPADSINDGDVIVGRLMGQFSTTSTPTINFQCRLGGTDFIETGARTTGSGVSAVGFILEYQGTVRTIGATGTTMWALWLLSGDSTVNIAVADTTADSTDFTAANDVDVTATWSASSASNTITATQHTLRVL